METETQQLVLREATALGDVVMVWRGKRLDLNFRLATKADRARLGDWAKEFNLEVKTGPDKDSAYIESSEGLLKCALKDLLAKSVKNAGYAVFAVDKKGRGRVLQRHTVDAEKLEDLREVAKVPRAGGG